MWCHSPTSCKPHTSICGHKYVQQITLLLILQLTSLQAKNANNLVLTLQPLHSRPTLKCITITITIVQEQPFLAHWICSAFSPPKQYSYCTVHQHWYSRNITSYNTVCSVGNTWPNSSLMQLPLVTCYKQFKVTNIYLRKPW